MRNLPFAVLVLVMAGCDGSDGPMVAPDLMNKVVSGPLEGVSEKGVWVWGDGINHLCQEWSSPGFFYGTGSGISSSADVAVLAWPDILELNDAESLEYSNTHVLVRAGHTAVFKGRNGFFGAWKIDYVTEDGLLYGTWYFRSGGGGDFTAEVVDTGWPVEKSNTKCSNVS